MRTVFSFAIVGALLVGGCRSQEPHVLGKPQDTSAPTILTGTLIEKCPTAGCWFRLKNPETGITKVNLASAGFVISEVPQGATVSAWGVKNAKTGELDATGLQW